MLGQQGHPACIKLDGGLLVTICFFGRHTAPVLTTISIILTFILVPVNPNPSGKSTVKMDRKERDTRS